MNPPIEPKKLSEEDLKDIEKLFKTFQSLSSAKSTINILLQHIAAQDNELETAINRYETEAMKAGRLEERVAALEKDLNKPIHTIGLCGVHGNLSYQQLEDKHTTALATIGVMREALEQALRAAEYNNLIVKHLNCSCDFCESYRTIQNALTQSPPEAI